MKEKNEKISSFSVCPFLDVEMEPCDGESPLVNEATMEAYSCQEDNGGEDCPSGSYCHIHPLGRFSACCAGELIVLEA